MYLVCGVTQYVVVVNYAERGWRIDLKPSLHKTHSRRLGGVRDIHMPKNVMQFTCTARAKVRGNHAGVVRGMQDRQAANSVSGQLDVVAVSLRFRISRCCFMLGNIARNIGDASETHGNVPKRFECRHTACQKLRLKTKCR